LLAFGSKLNQEAISAADFNPALLNDPDRVNNYATEVLLLQPLLNLDGVYARRAAKIQQEAYQLQEARTAEYLELEVSKLYMQLQLAYEAVAVLERAQTTAQEAVRMVQDFEEQGLAQKADVLDAQMRAGEVDNQLRYAISNVKNTSDQLALILGQSVDGSVYRPSESAATVIERAQFSAALPAYRKDVQAMELAMTGQENMLQSARMKFLPSINAFGSFQLYDDHLFGMNASGYVIGARMSWNLFDGYASISKHTKARLEAERAGLQHAQYTAQQQAELVKTHRMLADADSKVATTTLALQQAQEVYRMRKDRFAEGLEKTTDLLLSETHMYQKELAFKQAIFEYNFTKEYLHFLTR